MIRECTVVVSPEQAADEGKLRRYVQDELGIAPGELTALRVLKRSIDARQRRIKVNLQLRIYLNEEPEAHLFVPTVYRPLPSDAPVAVVVGAGPAGLFAALRLVEHGIRPVLVERGKDVHARRLDIADSLHILHVFCQHGASEAILSDAHPHLGSDKLPGIIERMRQTILRCGGEVRFGCRMEQILVDGGKTPRAVGIRTSGGEELRGPVILATGHSARDVYRHLAGHRRASFFIEPKGIAVGVRLEHPQQLIDSIQYHSPQGRGPWLPAAEYSFVAQSRGRGVYSFCMCPGGVVVPAATGPEQVVVNGMSASARSGRWANSGMVVEIRPEDAEPVMRDLPPAGEGASAEGGGALRVMHLQERLERLCWQQGGCRQTAPAQRMTDFVAARLSGDLPRSSYSPGLVASGLHCWLPEFVRGRLQEGLALFGKRCRGFLTREALLIGVETRTSAPVRIPRRADSLQHVMVEGLFPCGEGAGYAGGIVSAGVDGERCADALAAWLKK